MYDPYDPLSDTHPYNLGNNASHDDPADSVRGCLLSGLILLGFMALLALTFVISKTI